MSTIVVRRFAAPLVGFGFASLATAVGAQDAGPGDSAILEQVVVTAQKREEKLQDVPFQVNVFSEQQVSDAGIGSTQDFIGYVPNMTFDRADTYRNSFVMIRGLTQITNADSPVSVVIDGVPQNDQKQFNMRLFDIERIEVLKGPQGTLYGRNAIGGAVNIVTRAPTQESSGFAELSYGNGDAVQATGGISGPLGSDRLLYRLTADYLTDDGRIDNTFRGDHTDYVDYDYNVRGRLSFAATDTLSLDLRGQFGKFKGSSNQYSVVFSGDPNDFVEPQFNIRPFAEGETDELTFKLDADFGFATLTGITGYSRITETNRADLDFRNPIASPGGFLGLGFQAGQGQDLETKLLSQELRLTSRDDQPLRWLAGLYYLNTDKSLRTRAFIDLNGSTSQINNPGLVIIDRRESNDNDAYAAFGQVDYSLTDQWIVTAGARFDRDEREQTDVGSGAKRNKSFDAWQPKVTLSFRPEEDRTYYATVSTGFRSGGFNAPSVRIPQFKDEYLTNYEVGFKSTLLEQRLLLNAAVFYEQIDDYQYFFVDAASASQIIGNIDKVDVRGLEVEAQLRVARGWDIFGNVGINDSEIKTLEEFPQFEGNKAPKNTDWTGVIGTQYRGPFGGSALSWFGRVDLQHAGKKYWQIDNDDVQDPRTYLNMRFGLEGARWSVYLWGKNVTDERAYSEFAPREFSGLDVDIGYLNQPATYGVDARVTF
jgi:iron complex outermembrane receptor protein